MKLTAQFGSSLRTLAFNFSAGAVKSATVSALQRHRIAVRVGGITCSSSWADPVAAAAEAIGLDPNTAGFVSSLRERGIYPPPVDRGPDRLRRRGAVSMRKCDACGRIVPPHNLAHHDLVRVCDDCRIEPEATPEDEGEDLIAKIARAPGVRFDALLRGCDPGQTPREAARKKLSALGLSDQEITMMAFLIEGYSTRRIAEFVERSQTYIRKLQKSAERKLRRSGLSTPPAHRPSTSLRPPPFRTRSIDPRGLEAMTDRRD